MDFGTVVTAMVTPFNEQLQVDYVKTSGLIEHLIENGTDTIIIAGTTGEGPVLSKKEKLELLKFASTVIKGRIRLIANAGSNNTMESIEFIREIEALNCVDGLMVVNPYYNKPNQKGLYAHFKTIAESTDLPIMLYNIPGRTSVNLEADTTIALSKIPNIVAVKEAAGDLVQMSRIIDKTTDDFAVYSGDDSFTFALVALGGKGVVSVASHIYGNEIKEMIQTQSASLHHTLTDFYEAIFVDTNPIPIKYALNQIGVPVGSVRLPLLDMSKKDELFLSDVMEKTNSRLELRNIQDHFRTEII